MRKYLRSRHERFYKNSKFHLVADLVFVLSIILLFVAFILISTWHPRNNIILTAKALSSEIKSGNLETFELDYRANKASTNNSLAVKLPDNFILESVEPADSFDKSVNTFRLSDMEKGSNGKVKLTGLILGELGHQEDIGFTFNCAQCGGGIIASLPYKISGSVLDVSADLPNSVYRGVEFAGTIKVKNNGPKPLENIKIKAGNAWKITGGNEINIPKIAGGEEQAVSFFALIDGEQKNESLNLGYYLFSNNNLMRQGLLSHSIAIKNPNFKVFVEADKKVIKNQEEVVYSVRYQNQSEESLSDLKFNLSSGNPNFRLASWSILESEPKLKDEGSALVLPGELASDQGGRFTLKVKYNRLQAVGNQEVYLNINNVYALSGQALRYSVTSPVSKVVSQFRLKSGAYYYSPQGNQLGVGPVPPQVGLATSFWIFWEGENSGNELENLVVSAEIPESAVWMDDKSLLAGSLRHAEVGGRVVWEVTDLPSQTEKGQYRAGFSLGVIPEEKDLGKVLPLLTNIKYSARDKFTGQEVSGSLPDLDTNLAADVLSNGKGQVIAAD